MKISLFFQIENNKKYRNIATLLMAIYLVTSSLSYKAAAAEYTFIKNDTLWSLAEAYLKDPYQWPQIKNLNGTAIEDIYRIPIGHVVMIPDSIIKPIKLVELDNQSNVQTPKEDVIRLSEPHSKTLIQNPYHYLLLTKKTGLIRAYIDDQHVFISIPLLIDRIISSRPDIELKALSNGIAISTDLVKELLGIKK